MHGSINIKFLCRYFSISLDNISDVSKSSQINRIYFHRALTFLVVIHTIHSPLSLLEWVTALYTDTV